MRRIAVLGALVVAPVLVSGCGLLAKQHDIRIEVTGSNKAEEVVYRFPGQTEKDAKTGNTTLVSSTDRQVPLPWSKTNRSGFGFVDLSAKAENGPVGCKITVDGREVERKQSTDGRTVKCHYSVPDS